QMVSESSAPVPLARIASRLLSEVDGLDASTWSGHGSFREMIESMNLMPLVISWEAGGTISDPSRQAESNGVDRAVRARNWPDPALYDSAKRIHELTDVPLLTPEEYRNLLTMIVEDVREAPFHLVETSKRVRDRSRASGFPVSRADVNHVLRGLLMRGHKFDEGQNDYAALRSRLVDNIRSLCLREQIVLDSGTDGAIQRWIAT
ncbi:MAG TPA: hypothetical protein PK999_18900, partial [Nitrospira sp.]|nr:hypothetical protein [Nitrospira sp.]